MFCRKIDTKKGYAWECFDELPKDPVTGKRKRISARGRTKSEAKTKLEKKFLSITEYGLTTDPTQSKITFSQLSQEWLKTHQKNTKESAHRSNEYHVKRFGKYISNIEVRNITKKIYQNVIDQLHKDGYSYNTIYSAHSVAKKIFKQAIIWDVIKSSPADMAVLPRIRKTIEQIETEEVVDSYLERNELITFLKIVREKGLRSDNAIFTLLAFTGMRVGELLALGWRDVNFDDKEINISKTIFNVDGKKEDYRLLTPKTKTSIRKVNVDDNLLSLLKKHKQQQNQIKMENRDLWHDKDFIITRDDGYPLSPRFVHYRMKRIEKILHEQTDFTKIIHPHILRHTHTSMLTEAGVDLRAIMHRLGHTDGKTTLRVYTHVTDKMKKDTADKLGSLFGDLINSK